MIRVDARRHATLWVKKGLKSKHGDPSNRLARRLCLAGLRCTTAVCCWYDLGRRPQAAIHAFDFERFGGAGRMRIGKVERCVVHVASWHVGMRQWVVGRPFANRSSKLGACMPDPVGHTLGIDGRWMGSNIPPRMAGFCTLRALRRPSWVLRKSRGQGYGLMLHDPLCAWRRHHCCFCPAEAVGLIQSLARRARCCK